MRRYTPDDTNCTIDLKEISVGAMKKMRFARILFGLL